MLRTHEGTCVCGSVRFSAKGALSRALPLVRGNRSRWKGLLAIAAFAGCSAIMAQQFTAGTLLQWADQTGTKLAAGAYVMGVVEANITLWNYFGAC